MKSHSKFHLVICDFECRFIISRKCSRRCCKSNCVCVISSFFCNTNNFFKAQSCITRSSGNLDCIYVSGNTTAICNSLFWCRRKVIPLTHMGCLHTLCLTHFLCHIKVQVISCIVSIYKQNTFSLIHCLCSFHDQFRVRRCTNISTCNCISKSCSAISCKQRLMSASSTNYKGNFIFSMPFIGKCIVLTDFFIIFSISHQISRKTFLYNI